MNKGISLLVGVILIALGLYMFANMPSDVEQEPEPEVEVSVVELNGTSWDFDENGRLSFEDGRYSASVGCNRVAGAYTQDGGTISFEAGMTTLIGCPPEIAEAETKLAEDLGKITGIEGEEGDIVLSGGDVSLTLTPPVAEELVGGEWSIASIKVGSGIVSAAIDEGTFLTFNEDGTFSGKSACNNVMGGYEREGDAITFSNIASTRMACPEENMEREAVLIETLENVETYLIDRNTLRIESGDREYQLQLKK